MKEEDDFEIVDSENYMGQKNITFSHQDLVMRSMKRVLEIAGHELTEGISVGQLKGKSEKITIKEDTRKSFINAVRICKAVMNRDFDNEAKEIINKILDDVEKRKEELLQLQWSWWNNLNQRQKQDKDMIVERNFFNKSLLFYTEFIEYQIEKSWEIFEELNNLTARLMDYQVEDFEA